MYHRSLDSLRIFPLNCPVSSMPILPYMTCDNLISYGFITVLRLRNTILKMGYSDDNNHCKSTLLLRKGFATN